MFRALALVVLASAAPGDVAPASTPPPGWVVLPVEEYRALREKAAPPTTEPPPPPVEATLTSVEYELRAAGAAATGEVRLTIDVFRRGWVRMGVPGGLFVRAARLDGRPTVLVDGDGRKGEEQVPAVLLNRQGRSVLALDVDVPLSADADSERLALPSSRAALTRAVLVVPRDGVELAAAGGGILVEKSEGKGETRFLAVARPGASLALSWKRRKAEARADLPTRLRATLTEIYGLGEEGARASMVVALEVTQGAASGVRLSVPRPFEVSQVVGAMVAHWTTEGETLDVGFLDPVEDQTAFVVAGEARTPREGRIGVPLLRVPEAEREEGGVAVEVVGAGEVRARDARGLTAADPADLGEIVAGRDSPSLTAFRFRPGDGRLERGLSLEVVRYTPQAVLMANVEEARYRALLAEDGKMLVQGLYAVRNNQRSFLKLTLPEGATLWSAAVAHRPVRPGLTADGAVLLPLEKGRAGEEAPAFLVEIVYLARGASWDRSGSAAFPLPVLDLGISRLALELGHSPRYRLKPVPGPLREAAFALPVSLAFASSAPAPEKTVSQAEESLERQIRELPLNGRNFAQLTLLQPGLVGSERAGRANEEFARKQQEQEQKAAAEVQGLVDRFQREAGFGARVRGTLPVEVGVPQVGPRLFFVAELTPEGTAPALDFTYKRAK